MAYGVFFKAFQFPFCIVWIFHSVHEFAASIKNLPVCKQSYANYHMHFNHRLKKNTDFNWIQKWIKGKREQISKLILLSFKSAFCSSWFMIMPSFILPIWFILVWHINVFKSHTNQKDYFKSSIKHFHDYIYVEKLKLSQTKMDMICTMFQIDIIE